MFSEKGKKYTHPSIVTVGTYKQIPKKASKNYW